MLFESPHNLVYETFLAHASALGLDTQLFRKCMATRASDGIRRDQAEGRRLDVKVTPTFFVGVIQSSGRIALSAKIVGAQPYATFKSAIDNALKESGAE